MQLGYVNVDAMLRSITIKQFREWRAFAALEPFDEMRMDYRIASIVQTLRASYGVNSTLEECLLTFSPAAEAPRKHQTWQEKLAIARAIALAFNAPGQNV